MEIKALEYGSSFGTMDKELNPSMPQLLHCKKMSLTDQLMILY